MTPREKAQEAARWWHGLQPDPERKRPGDRAALARLRRCETVLDAAVEPAALDFAKRVGVRGGEDPALGDALLAAVVLAHVRKDAPGLPVARQLGAAGADKRAAMSPLRLARLLAADTREERLVAFRRAVALADRTLDVRDLAHALLDWSERRRVAWAFAYHAVPPPGTDADPTRPADGGTA